MRRDEIDLYLAAYVMMGLTRFTRVDSDVGQRTDTRQTEQSFGN